MVIIAYSPGLENSKLISSKYGLLNKVKILWLAMIVSQENIA